MIEGWDRGPRDRSQRASQIHEAMDWIYRLGPQVVIEVRDLNGGDGRGQVESKGVVYADLAVGEGASAHRLPLGPVLYGYDEKPETDRSPLKVQAVEDALRIEEQRGREVAAFMLSKLKEIEA